MSQKIQQLYMNKDIPKKPCKLQLDIYCKFLQQQFQNIVLSSKKPVSLSDMPEKPQLKSKIIKQKRHLRLSFQSIQLKNKFQSVVGTVPGRKTQAYRIFDFISMSENGASSPICLHGNTGCGKTSLVTGILDFFAKNIETVSVAYMNCMSMWSSQHVFGGILQKLYSVKPRKYRKLDSILYTKLRQDKARKDQKTKIVVLDEVDQCFNDQSFVYNILQTLQIGAKLILIFISNVIDFTFKLDSNKLQSRLRFQKVIFKPYDFKQIQEIIYYKYANITNLIQKQGVGFLAKKICNINSDIRLLQKIYNKIVEKIEGIQTEKGNKKRLDLNTLNQIISQDTRQPNFSTTYMIILRILNKAAKKQDISSSIMNGLYSYGEYRTEDILMILLDLQDYGLISLNGNPKNSDASFHEYGIKIHEDLYMQLQKQEYK